MSSFMPGPEGGPSLEAITAAEAAKVEQAATPETQSEPQPLTLEARLEQLGLSEETSTQIRESLERLEAESEETGRSMLFRRGTIQRARDLLRFVPELAEGVSEGLTVRILHKGTPTRTVSLREVDAYTELIATHERVAEQIQLDLEPQTEEDDELIVATDILTQLTGAAGESRSPEEIDLIHLEQLSAACHEQAQALDRLATYIDTARGARLARLGLLGKQAEAAVESLRGEPHRRASENLRKAAATLTRLGLLLDVQQETFHTMLTEQEAATETSTPLEFEPTPERDMLLTEARARARMRQQWETQQGNTNYALFQRVRQRLTPEIQADAELFPPVDRGVILGAQNVLEQTFRELAIEELRQEASQEGGPEAAAAFDPTFRPSEIQARTARYLETIGSLEELPLVKQGGISALQAALREGAEMARAAPQEQERQTTTPLNEDRRGAILVAVLVAAALKRYEGATHGDPVRHIEFPTGPDAKVAQALQELISKAQFLPEGLDVREITKSQVAFNQAKPILDTIDRLSAGITEMIGGIGLDNAEEMTEKDLRRYVRPKLTAPVDVTIIAPARTA